jgi:hypothetical protein
MSPMKYFIALPLVPRPLPKQILYFLRLVFFLVRRSKRVGVLECAGSSALFRGDSSPSNTGPRPIPFQTAERGLAFATSRQSRESVDKSPHAKCTFVVALVVSLTTTLVIAQTNPPPPSWKPLFTGTNFSGWTIHLEGRAKNEDPDKLVQYADGELYFYRDAEPGSQQPIGYIATEKEYSNYRLRLDYRWREKKFAPRMNSRRNSGVIYHITTPGKVWPDTVECQIMENDTGDIYALYTRVTAPVDPKSTNATISYTTNRNTGVIRTNSNVRPRYLELEKGGVLFTQGRAGAIPGFARHPSNERDGWNLVEVEVHGDRAIHVVNGVTNNIVLNMQHLVDGEWKPLTKGHIALQLEGAEIFFRNIEIMELSE